MDTSQDGKGSCPEPLEFPIGGEHKDVSATSAPSRRTFTSLFVTPRLRTGEGIGMFSTTPRGVDGRGSSG